MHYDKKNTYTEESTYSEIGQAWQNPIQRTETTAHLSVLMTVHNFSTQYNTVYNSFDNLRSYLQTTIIDQMLFIGGKGVPAVFGVVSRR